MSKGLRRWFIPGAGIGWTAVLLGLAAILPSNRHFVDDPLLAALLLFAAPALIGGGAAVATALVASRIWRRARRIDEIWTTRFSRASLGAGTLLLGICLVAIYVPPPKLHARTFVFGIDGATWNVIDAIHPLGMTPHIDRLRADGASGTLLSLEPMLSPIVWTTIASGVPLEKHGIQGFHTTNPSCRAARLWDIAESRGQVVGLYKWLVTYPPREISGFMIPGWLATGPETEPEDLRFARAFEMGRRARMKRAEGEGEGAGKGAGVEPPSSLSFLRQGIRHGLRLSTVVAAARTALRLRSETMDEGQRLTEIYLLRARIDRDLFIGLMERYDPDFAAFVYYPTDAVAHRMWRYYEPDKFGGVDERGRELWDAIPSAYRLADEFLGEFRARLSDDATLLVLSDHGLCAAGSEGAGTVYGVRAGQVRAALDAEGAAADVAQVGAKVTVAVAGDSPVSAEDVEALLRRFTFDGAPFFRLEELSPGVYGLTLAPTGDLAARSAELVTLPDGQTVALERFLRTRADYSGVHHAEGIILLAGPGIRPGAGIADADLYDVAPTLLTAMGIPPSRDMVGRVLAEAFTQVPDLPAGPADYGDTMSELVFRGVEGSEAGAAALERMLQSLGYVDTDGGAP